MAPETSVRYQSLTMGTEMDPKTSAVFNQMTRLIAREDSINTEEHFSLAGSTRTLFRHRSQEDSQ
jgi:hypothetical protein